MKRSLFTQKIYSYLLSAQQWYLKTPERSLDEAYKAALVIKAMEDEHFNGKKIAPESASYGDSVMAYFQSELKKQLKTVRMRLTEFKLSRSLVSSSNQTITKLARNDGTIPAKDSFAIQTRNNPSLILEKLRFIDEVLAKYTSYKESSSIVVTSPQAVQLEPATNVENQQKIPVDKLDDETVTKSNQVGVIPRSIIKTINRLKVELDPKAEKEVVKNFRISQKRTLISVRFILLLIIVPFLTQQLSKNIIIGPIVDNLRSPDENKIFLNYEMEERALVEMQRFEEKIKFENLISKADAISPERVEEEMRNKVHELTQEYREESSNAIKNVFADILAVGAFIWLLVFSKREIAVLKDFIDNVVYGLSDSAKAFIIILFTDIFVGFHSPHGWEVLLSGVSRHLGLPENHDFIFLFIATFPVILDTVFKYWIFRYLSRISPSAVATYRNMNE
jgi:hypothetical protein